MIQEYKIAIKHQKNITEFLERKHRSLAPTVHPKPTKRSNEIAKRRIQHSLSKDPRFNVDDDL